MKGDFCNADAVTYLAYSGAHLCPEHFNSHVERLVKKEIRKQVKLRRGDVVGVAVSGGKDSMVLLSIMSTLFHEYNGIRLVCISIDEGI